jgi:hypothetical protein
MTYSVGMDRFSVGRVALALLASMALFTTFAFFTATTVRAQGEGEADCPEGTTFVLNVPATDLEEGLVLAEGVTVTAVTLDDSDEVASVTILNESGDTITIAVKSGSDQVGESTEIPDGTSATITMTSGQAISNLSLCEGPAAGDDDDDTGDDDDDTVGDDDDDTVGDDDDEGTAGGGGGPAPLVPDTAVNRTIDPVIPALGAIVLLSLIGGVAAFQRGEVRRRS